MEINGYRLGRKIAETEFCSVHNALDLATSKTVSVRIFNPRLMRHPGFCAGFSRFAESLLGERLGVMVGLLQYEASETACYAVTDYFPCLPLLQAQAVQMPAKALLQGGIEIAATIDLLHQRDLVHGALRPGNLFFNDQMKVTLGLGINRPEGEGSRPPPIDSAMAALYLPPEGGDGPSADYYALGISLHQLLFGHPPFDEQNPRLQHQQKQKVLARFSSDGHDDLLPLFQALLHPDPEQRIGNSEDFWQAANACGYRLLQPPFKAAPPPSRETPPAEAAAPSPPAKPAPASGSDKPAEEKPASPEDRSEPSRKPVLIAGGIAAAMAVALLAWFLMPADTGSEARAPQAVTASTADTPDAAAAARPDEKPAPTETPEPDIAPQETEPASNVVARPPDEIPRDEELFLRARSLFAEGNPGAALISVNEALKINPQQQDALQLHKSIRNELEARRILKRAEEQLLAGRLSSPPGDNALESYRSLGELLPKRDPRMQKGLSRVANRYLELSRKLVAQRKLDRAFQLADSGSRLFPGFAPLQALRNDIQQQLADQQRRLSEARKQEQIRRIEAARKQKQAQLQASRKQWLQSFDKALAGSAPGITEIERATAAYDELQKLKTPAKQLDPLRKRLLQAHVDLSEQQIAAEDFNAANATLEQASRLGDNSGVVQRQLARLQAAMEKQQQGKQVSRLLSEAQLLIQTATANPGDLQKAASLLNQASAISPDDPRIAGTRERLLVTIDQQVATAIQARRFDDADRLVSMGRQLSGSDSHWQSLAQQVQQARADEKRKSVPVIGTF